MPVPESPSPDSSALLLPDCIPDGTPADPPSAQCGIPLIYFQYGVEGSCSIQWILPDLPHTALLMLSMSPDQLNDSTAAKGLYEQLPLTLEVKDFSTNEKTFYPPKELDVTDTPVANADKGTLAYYAPWADVVMFYDYFGTGNSLYELGEVVSGKENIENLQGTIIVEVVE